MAIENRPFIGTFPIETQISSGFPLATFDQQRLNTMSEAAAAKSEKISHRIVGSFHSPKSLLVCLPDSSSWDASYLQEHSFQLVLFPTAWSDARHLQLEWVMVCRAGIID